MFSTISNRGTLQPKLRQPLTVYHGRISCHICFVSFDKRNIKRELSETYRPLLI